MGPGADPFENGLTIALPWMVVLVLALVQAALQLPRDPFTSPDRLLIVGRATAQTPILDDDSAKQTGDLTGPALFDLAQSDAKWLALYAGGRVARAKVTFRPEQLQGQIDAKAIDTGNREIDLLVTCPQPDDYSPRLLRVDAQAYRLVPPATWDTYLYELEDGQPKPLLVLRSQPAALETSRNAEGADVYSHEALRRHNLRYVWTGETLELQTWRTRSRHWGWLFAGAFAALPWWGWLLVALPVGGLLLGASRAVLSIGALSRRGRTANAEMSGLVLALALLALAIAAIVYLRQWPLLDRVTALLAPVLLVLSVNLGVVTTAKMAVVEAGRTG